MKLYSRGPYGFWEVHTALDGPRLNQSNCEFHSCYTIIEITQSKVELRIHGLKIKQSKTALTVPGYNAVFPRKSFTKNQPVKIGASGTRV